MGSEKNWACWSQWSLGRERRRGRRRWCERGFHWKYCGMGKGEGSGSRMSCRKRRLSDWERMWR